MAEFKDRLEQALKMRNMKPADLARLTGIGEGAISQYRKGAYKATQRNLEKIAKVLDVSIPWLMGSENAQKSMLSFEDKPDKNIIKIAGRDGTFIEKRLSDKQIKALEDLINSLPDLEDESI